MTQAGTVTGRPRKIRVGLIGVGNWARHGHLRVLQLLPDYEVVAVTARRREAAEAAASAYGIAKVVDTAEKLAALPEVDLVAVLTTAPQHADGVRAAIAAGKDVYSEWPLTLNSTIADELHAAAERAGVRHVIGLQRRVAAFNRYLRDLIAEGYVGRLRSVRIHVSMNYFQATRSQSLAWTAPPENFSGVVAIYAGHFLDMLFHAVGRPDTVQALAVNQFPVVTIRETGERIPTTAPDQLVALATLANGAVLSVHIEGGKRNGSGVSIDITGDAGDLRITNTSAFGGVGDDYLIEGSQGDDRPLQRLEVPARYDWLPPSPLPSAVLELANLYATFAQGDERGIDRAPDFGDAAWMHRLIEAFERSSQTGERIAVAPSAAR